MTEKKNKVLSSKHRKSKSSCPIFQLRDLNSGIIIERSQRGSDGKGMLMLYIYLFIIYFPEARNKNRSIKNSLSFFLGGRLKNKMQITGTKIPDINTDIAKATFFFFFF